MTKFPWKSLLAPNTVPSTWILTPGNFLPDEDSVTTPVIVPFSAASIFIKKNSTKIKNKNCIFNFAHIIYDSLTFQITNKFKIQIFNYQNKNEKKY